MDREHPLSTATYRESSDRQCVPGSGGLDWRGSADARLGRQLAGRFELTGLLGIGSFGDVYEARDLHSPGAPIALKLLRHPSAHALYRFKREFRALAEVSHPNLVALHELFLDESDAFFTLELVRGVDFHSFVRPLGVLSRERLAQALRGLCEGVSALHARGRLHRDLKPGNVLCEPGGRVVIVDFGLATLFAHGDEQGSEQGFVGTANYAAPEQLAMGEVGPESDWYAVGTMLYEALSGTLPFEGPFSALWAAKGRTPEPLPELPPDLLDLGELCLRMLAPDKELRAGAGELARALGELPRRAPTGTEQPFVGRAAQLAELHALFARVEHGALSAPVVLASSGLGKTALVERFLDQLRSDHRAIVLRGRCYVNEDVAYRAVDGIVDALSHYLSSLPAAKTAALLPRDARALARLFPVLNRVSAIATAPAVRPALPDDQASLRVRAVDALRELLTRIGDHLPLVLFVDDIQWDDADSGWFLSALLNDVSPPAMLLVATCRSDVKAHSHVLRALAGNVETMRVLHEIELPPLSVEETLSLTSQVVPGAPVEHVSALQIARESAGHPMFAIELARFSEAAEHARPTGELSLEAALRSRADQLAGTARALLDVVCVAGHRLKLRSALLACGLEAAPLRELVTSKLAIASGRGLDATLEAYHDRVREALVAALSEPRRRALHGAIADALQHEPAPRFDLIVEHNLAAGRPELAAQFALRAADQAASVLALHRVPALLTLALTEPDSAQRAALYVRLGEAYALIGRTGDSAHAYQAATELTPDATQRWELTRLAMGQALLAEELELGQSLLRELDHGLGLHGVRPTALRALYATLLHVSWLLFGPPRLRSPVDSEARERDRKRLRLAWSAAAGLGGSHVLLGLYYCIYCFTLAARVGDAARYASVLALFAAGRGVSGGRALAKSERMLAEAQRLAEGSDDPDVRIFVAVNEASYHLYTKSPPRAEEALDRIFAMRFPATPLSGYLRSILYLMCGPVFFWRGRLTRMRSVAIMRARELQELPDPHADAGVRALTAYRLLAEDDERGAWDEWRLTAERFPEHSALRGATWGVVPALYAGDLAKAEQALAIARRLFLRWDVHSALARNLFFWNIGSVSAQRLLSGQPSLRARLRVRGALWLMRLAGAGPIAQNPLLAHLLSTRAFARGEPQRGVAYLEQAHRQFQFQGMRLYEACAALLLSRHHESAEARARYAAAADEIFLTEQVREPDKWTRALLPGVPLTVS